MMAAGSTGARYFLSSVGKFFAVAFALSGACAVAAAPVPPTVILADLDSAPVQTDRLVRSTDGVVLAVHEWGDPSRPTIVLVHGYLQSYLSFARQFGPLSHEFHVVAFDLRGHGGSDKPLSAASYREAWRWADDINAVLRATAGGSRVKPVLVGWSMGGRVILDYVQKFKDTAVGGFVFVDSGLKRGPGMASAANAGLISDLEGSDLGASIGATRAFLRHCFEHQPDPGAFETMIAYNMVVPPLVRTYLAGRPLDFDATLAALRRPTLVIQGEKDALITPAAARYTAHQVPGARLLVYPGVGHSSFWEASERFNADLAAFVRRVAASGGS